MRPQVQLNLGVPGLRPTASPVDTYYQPNEVPDGDAIDNGWLQGAKMLEALSPSIAKFLQDREKADRERMPQEAEAAVGAFKGDLSILKQLPSMTPEQADAWFETNKGAFGNYPLDYQSRPDFILNFQTFAGRRWAREGKVATDRAGNPATYREALYSRMDEFADPDTDIEGQLAALRNSVFEGIEMNERGQQWRLGVLDALTPVEREFRQVVSHQQQKHRGERMAESVVGELYQGFNQWNRSRVRAGDEPAVEGETNAERKDREARNEARRAIEADAEQSFEELIKNVVGGYTSVGGKDRNKLITEAIEMMARDVQDDENDGLEVTDFIAWVGELQFEDGKSLEADPFWRERLREIEDDMYMRGKRMDKEGDQLTLSEVTFKVRGPLLEMLRDSDASTVEEALNALNGGEGEKMVAEELEKAGLDAGFLSTIISDQAQSYVDGRSQRSGRLNSTNQAMLDDFYKRLATEGPTAALESALKDATVIEALGGAGPNGQWGALWDAFTADKAKGRRDSSYTDAVQMAMDSVMPEADLRLFPDAEANEIRQARMLARERLDAALAAETDPEKREALRRTLGQQIGAQIRSSEDFQYLLDQSYDRQPELLVDASKAVTSRLDSMVEAFLPRVLTQDDGVGGLIRVPAPPENEGRRQIARAQLRSELVENTSRLLDFYAGERDSRTRNAMIQRDLELGNREAGVRPMHMLVKDYFRPQEDPQPEAPPDTRDTNAIRVSRAEDRLEGLRASRNAVDGTRLESLGGTVPSDMESEVIDAISGGRMALQLLGSPKLDAFGEGLKSVHGTRMAPRQAMRLDSYGRPYYETTLHQIGAHYPSNNRVTRIYASALLADPSANKQPTHWRDNGDYVSDVGVDFNEMAAMPASLLGHLKFAVVQDGISFRELEKGQIREGTKLEKIFGAKSEWPIDVMHIGPQAPKEFEAAFAEWANESTRANSAYQKAMLALGILPDEKLSDGSGATQGDKFMKILKSNYDTRREAMDDQMLLNIQRPYSSFSRMTTGERIYRDVREGVTLTNKKAADGDYDSLIHSPAVRYVLEQEKAFLSDD